MTMLDPHLDVDQLSAAVDGTDDPAVATHLVGCLACRDQVEVWRRTLAPLQSLPAPPADIDPVLAALATWSSAPDEAGRVDVGLVDVGLVDVGLVDAGLVEAGPAAPRIPAGAELHRAALAEAEAELRRGTPAPSRRPGARPAPGGPGRRPSLGARVRRLRPPAGVVAALVLLVLLAAAVVGIKAGGHGSSSATASKSSSAPTSKALRTESGGAVAEGTATPEAPAPGQAATAAPPSYAGTAQLVAELRHVVDRAGTAVPAAAVPAASPCLPAARRLAARDPGVGSTPPSYTEVVTLAGVTGRVFVFSQTHGHVAVVVRSATCALLATVSF